MQLYKNFIDGKWIESEKKETIKVDDPATGKIIGDAPYSRTGREKLNTATAGRGGETLRYEIGGGDSKYVSSRTAKENWF